jgi:hypothetical protein
MLFSIGRLSWNQSKKQRLSLSQFNILGVLWEVLCGSFTGKPGEPTGETFVVLVSVSAAQYAQLLSRGFSAST